MQKRILRPIFGVFLVAMALAAACIEPVEPPFPTETPPGGTSTAIAPSETPIPTVTNVTSVTPTTAPPTSTGIPITEMIDLPFQNPGFEGPYVAFEYRGRAYDNILVAEGWHPVACADPWVTGGCAAYPLCGEGQTIGCNPPDTRAGRPEYNPAFLYPDERRVYQGARSQHWFEFYRAGIGGVYQTVFVPPGYEYCTVGARVMSWSNSQDVYTSQLATADDRRNVTWRIYVDMAAGAMPFVNGVLVSNAFGYDTGIYDEWVGIDYSFPVGSDGGPVTVFFMTTWLWPFKHNDSYLDGVWGWCERSINPDEPVG